MSDFGTVVEYLVVPAKSATRASNRGPRRLDGDEGHAGMPVRSKATRRGRGTQHVAPYRPARAVVSAGNFQMRCNARAVLRCSLQELTRPADQTCSVGVMGGGGGWVPLGDAVLCL